MPAQGYYEQWSGINDNLTDIAPSGDTTSYSITNAALLLRGECGRRLGFGNQIVDSGIVVAELVSIVMFITASGNIQVDSQ